MIDVRLEHVRPFVEDETRTNDLKTRLKEAKKALQEKKGPGSAFTGWVDLPARTRQELDRIRVLAARHREMSDVLLVIGIGGSYLGARAALEALDAYFPHDDEPEVIFAGHNISGEYLEDLRDYLSDKRFSINVISKSGTTTEPAIAFRFFKRLLEERFGADEAKERIVATTDASKGALRTLADKEGYETFVIPDDVGGRYSFLTPVGLFPVAFKGHDIESMLDGAENARERYFTDSEGMNPLDAYVMYRNALYESGKKIELFVHYEPKFRHLSEWWKQLFGESEGKDGKGLFVASASFTTDLHSLGQYIQDGERHLFATVFSVKEPRRVSVIREEKNDSDNLNYLAGTTVDTVNKKAMEGTLIAHESGNVPSIVIETDKMDAYTFGHVIYFFELACALSGYVLGVNPFDQPGVEAYKRNMFALLGKKGFEDRAEELAKRMKKTR